VHTGHVLYVYVLPPLWSVATLQGVTHRLILLQLFRILTSIRLSLRCRITHYTPVGVIPFQRTE